jgi:hypothetical protein
MRISGMRGMGRPAGPWVLGLLLSLGLILGSSELSEGTTTILRVTPEGAGTRDGSSWADALGEAEFISNLALAFSGTEYWLAKGSYRPAIPADSASITETERGAAFTLAHRVKIYGGFAGTETERSRRDWTANVTVLTGDLGNDDLSKVNGATTDYSGIVGTNSATVVRAYVVDESAVLDGVTVCGGSAEAEGGGLCSQGAPTVKNCIFSGNRASQGGGVYNCGDRPALTDCTFSGNRAVKGGGMSNQSCSLVTLTGCTFSGDISSGGEAGNQGGGGMLNQGCSQVVLTDCTFSGNRAYDGSSYGNGGGMLNHSCSQVTLTDCTFSGNQAENGGGMSDGYCSLITLTGCTFSKNYATGGGGLYNAQSILTATNCTVSSNQAFSDAGLFLYDGDLTLVNCTFTENNETDGAIVGGNKATLSARNCIFWNEEEKELGGFDSASDSVTYSVVKGGRTGAGNLTLDPELKALTDNGGPTLTHALPLGSCAVDAGTSADVPSEDQRGVSRPKGAGYDMGAYELDPGGDSVLTPTVTPTVTPSSVTPSVAASPAGGSGCSVGLFAPMLAFPLVPLLLRRRR